VHGLVVLLQDAGLACKVVSGQCRKRAVSYAARARGASWIDGRRYVIFGQPHLDRPHVAVAVPRVLVQLNAVHLVQRYYCTGHQLRQSVVVQLERLQLVDAHERSRRDLLQFASGQVQPDEAGAIPERFRPDALYGVIGQRKVSEQRYVGQRLRRYRGQQVFG